MKKSLTIVGIILLTVILAALSVLTALRLKEMGTRPVAPSVPESKPEAVDVGPPEGLTPATICQKSLSVGETAPGVYCADKIAYRDDSRNTAGEYYLEDRIEEGETVSKGEKVVFNIKSLPLGTAKETVIADVLSDSLDFVDAGVGCVYASATRTVTCTLASVADIAIRVAVRNDADESITNTAKVQAEGDPESTCSVTLTVATVTTGTPTPTATPTGAPGSMCEYLHADKTSGQPTLTVGFEGKGFDPVRVKGFRFTFGDGEKKEVFGSFTSDHTESISHSYSKVGTYKAVLEILDDGDHWKTRPECEVTIKVTGEGATTTPTELAEATPTETTLPVAGLKIPTLAGILAGFLLISLGAALVF
ncbi:MAG TPA: hypothetical protein VMW04_04465 [Patescibacteria group bacterium]|nr:hypothetical protein [Patescibacteria group bacterium]